VLSRGEIVIPKLSDQQLYIRDATLIPTTVYINGHAEETVQIWVRFVVISAPAEMRVSTWINMYLEVWSGKIYVPLYEDKYQNIRKANNLSFKGQSETVDK